MLSRLIAEARSLIEPPEENPVVESMFDLMERGKKHVAIFDFDGTLFKSPSPPKWWEKKPWWHAPSSLNPPCVPKKPGAEWWNQKLLGVAKKKIGDPATHTVLLTGRWSSVFTERVRELLHQVGLNFDEVLLSTSPKTLPFKAQVLRGMLAKGTLDSVEVWDDHPTYTRTFQSLLDKAGVKFSIKNAKTLSHEPVCKPSEV